MKLSNIFKKKVKATKTSNTVTLDKNGLKNIIGGGDPVPGIDVKLGTNHK